MWLEEAKKRVDRAMELCPGVGPVHECVCTDAPRAYALLERAREIVTEHALWAQFWDHQKRVNEAAAWLRDLEGKEETDAQDEKG